MIDPGTEFLEFSAMAAFENIFPTFLQKCAELNELLRIVAFALFIVGTIL